MPQINLLKQKSTGQNIGEFIPSFLVKVFLLVGLCVLVYYIWLVFSAHSIASDMVTVENKIAADKAAAMAVKDRSELLTRQQQLAQLSTLVSQHVYWTHILPELAKSTLNTAVYTSLRAANDGTITVSAKVPTLQDLDKFLQVFNNPLYNADFSNIHMGSYHLVQLPVGTAIGFDVRMDYNPAILQYKDQITNLK